MLTRLAAIFYWRVILGLSILHMINRQFSQVQKFISEFFEFQKYTFDTDYYRLFCFWQILFSMCCLLILMNIWVVSGVWTMGKLEYSRYYTNINKEWVHNNTKSGNLFSYTNGSHEIFCWVLCCEVFKFWVRIWWTME